MKNIQFIAVFVAALALLMIISGCAKPTTPPLRNYIQDTCNGFGGTFDMQYNECTGVSKEQCDSLNGTFNECASACRHDPTAQVCTMQCVIVCQI